MTEGHGNKFSRRQETAIAALLTERTMAEAAAKCGVSEKTLYRWSLDPGFDARYKQARSAMLTQAVNVLRQGANEASDTLIAVARDTTAPANARVSAARTVLEMLLRSRELDELEARLEALERASLELQRAREER
jgi:DNA-binding MurR/RpiR family transcriptional regulator